MRAGRLEEAAALTAHIEKDIKLENMATNDALPLKAARCDATANLKSFWGLGTPATQFQWLHLR